MSGAQNAPTPQGGPGSRLMRSAQVIIVGSIMFSFISYWRTAAVVLCDLASTAYYIGALVEQAIGPAAPWFILAVMLFSYAVRSVYIESCSLFVRGGVYRVVKEAMGGFLAKLSVLYIHTSSKREVVVVLETARPMSATDRALVEVFCSRLSVAFDNVILYDQLHEANIRLEERVRERTHALTFANHRLSSQWTRLRRSNEFKNEILGTVAHDLRNPLGVILGRAEMMNELVAIAPVQVDKIRDQLGHIRASAGQMTELVNDLISDAMMDAHNIAIRREQIDLVTMLGEIVTANRALAEKKNQSIQLVAPAHQMWSCDPDRLREAVDNLVSNAIKYSPIAGHIELTMSLADAHILALEYLRAGGNSEFLNLGTGRGYSVLEVIECVREVTGREIPSRIEAPRAGDPARLIADPSKAKALLRWEAAVSDLPSIVRSAWNWRLRHPNGYTSD